MGMRDKHIRVSFKVYNPITITTKDINSLSLHRVVQGTLSANQQTYYQLSVPPRCGVLNAYLVDLEGDPDMLITHSHSSQDRKFFPPDYEHFDISGYSPAPLELMTLHPLGLDEASTYFFTVFNYAKERASFELVVTSDAHIQEIKQQKVQETIKNESEDEHPMTTLLTFVINFILEVLL